MHNLLILLAIVFLVRYYALDDGRLIGATASFGWTGESCAAKKIAVDREADPEGTKTVTDCAEESELPFLLSPGSRT